MRLTITVLLVLLCALLVYPEVATSDRRTAPSFLSAQSSQVLLPEQSSVKAKEMLQQTIQALGGEAYLNVRDTTCTGRYATFDRQESVGGYAQFIDYIKWPDRNRTEFYKQRNIINVRTSTAGWDMDRGGVQDSPPDSIEAYNDGLKRDMDYVLRFRLKEDGMVFRYGGTDLVDLKRVEWVEIVDRDRRTMRIAIDQTTHLPLRAVVTSRDKQTRERTEETSFYANWHVMGGVMTSLQLWRERNGRKYYQVFFDECKYNTSLTDAFFTRESLEQRFAELNKGKKKK